MRNPVLKKLEMSRDDYRQVVQQYLAPHRLELISARAAWIRKTEKWITDYFIAGDQVNTDTIQPKLELVTTDKQHEIWRYCRLWGSIPYNRGCGRLIRYLLRDVGQPGAPIMGILALSSPILICKPRDAWIGWKYPDDVDLKRRRLLTCMDLSVSMAIPPYNHLTTGKLICLAALSDQVRHDYSSKFSTAVTPTGMQDGRLSLVVTTSLYGSSIQYNRLKVGDRNAYQLVGYTTGYGNAHITELEFAVMENFLKTVGKQIPKGWGTGRSYRLRVLKAYYRYRYNGQDAPPHEHCRSIYVAPLSKNTQAFLRGEEHELDYYEMPLANLVEQWRLRWLTARLRNPEVMQRFSGASPTDQLLSTELSADTIAVVSG